MIKNERQYRITKAQSDKFEAALRDLITQGNQMHLHPLLLKAQIDAVRSQFDDLRREITDYEALRDGEQKIFEANSWSEFPDTLIRARIAAGLSQKELAERLGLKEQQIQRYETTGYSAASFERLGEIMKALGVQVREEVYLPTSGLSLDTLMRRVGALGFGSDFVRRRLLPKGVREGGVGDAGALAAASHVGKIFGWPPAMVFGQEPLSPSRDAIASARMHVSMNAREQHTTAYAVYAHYLCMLLLDATKHLRQQSVPSTGREAYDAIIAATGTLGFAEALRFVWSLGIPVLPLDDAGAFYGACWRSSGRNVICVKQRTKFPSRWLDVLVHELGHCAQHSDQPEFSVIEEGDTLEDRRDSQDEKDAVRYSSQTILGGRAEHLAELCVTAAKGSVERLKRIVPEVALREGVGPDMLANYMAFRLSRQNIDWWGAATNLQPAGQNPWIVARDILLEYVDLSVLAEPDRDLLISALMETEA